MNSFTDDDLKRLKDWLEEYKKGPGGYHAYPPVNLDTLLARLEAAEECAGLLKVHYEAGTFAGADELDNTLAKVALRAWRKAAGK